MEHFHVNVPEHFNFAYDVIDAYAATQPQKEAILYVNDNGDERPAYAYIANPTLRKRLVEITEVVYNSDKSVYEIFGNDAIKVRSCMLLFASVSDEPIFKKMISKYCWR